MASKKRDGGEEQASSPWVELPSEVQSSILGRLPLRCLFRSKLVCKLWNSTISSPSFTNFPSLLNRPCGSPWLIFFPPTSFAILLAFDFDERSWFKLDMCFLSSLLNASSAPTSSGLIQCTGTASGLLLLHSGCSLHVCNPLTKSLVKLPPFKCIEVLVSQGFSTTNTKKVFTPVKTGTLSRHGGVSSTAPSVSSTSSNRNAVAGLLMPMDMGNNVTGQHECASEVKGTIAKTQGCSCRHGYTLVVVGKAKRELVLEAYCPVENMWEIVGTMPASFIIGHDRMIECGGLFYGLLLNPIGMLVIGESGDEGDWNWRVQAMPIRYWREACGFLACQNSIFMVCYGDLHHNGFAIWRYQADLQSWIKLQDMPDSMSKDVKRISYSTWVDCVGVGSFICFRALGTLKVLTYNLCNELWSWLPEPSYSHETVFTRGLQFEPRLGYTQL